MTTIKLKVFINDVTELKVGDICKKMGIAESTLRDRWNNPKKRKEVIYLVVGYLANNQDLAKELIKTYC